MDPSSQTKKKKQKITKEKGAHQKTVGEGGKT